MHIKSQSKQLKVSQTPALTISIVNYNTFDLLIRCVKTIYRYTKGVSFEIIVIDNNSKNFFPKKLKRQFPNIKIIVNPTNTYYSAANNQALKIAQGKYFLVLNPDMYLTQDVFSRMVAYFESNPQTGCVEPLQIDDHRKPIITGTKHKQPLIDLIELTFLRKIPGARKLLQSTQYINRDRRSIWEADVVCGGVLMIRTSLMKQLKGFNKNLKLYYGENDLCQRTQSLGYNNIHMGTVSINHSLSSSTNKISWEKIAGIYATDSYKYYSKFYNLFIGLIVSRAIYLNIKLAKTIKKISNINLLKSKPSSLSLIFLSILILATFLRFHQIDTLVPFIGDQGRDFLAARDFVLTGQAPLLGIPSSDPRFHQGPLYIWIVSTTFYILGFNPLNPILLASVLGLLTVGLTFILIQKLTNSSIALTAGLILASSPFAVIESRMAYHTNPIPIFSLFYLYSLYLLYTKKTSSLFLTTITFALLFQFELVTAPLILLIPITMLIKKMVPNLKHLLTAFFGLAAGLIPQIIYDLTHNFSHLSFFSAWVGYKTLGFVGIFPKHQASMELTLNVFKQIFHYLQKFFFWQSDLLTIPFIIFVILGALNLRKPPRSPLLIISTLWLLIMFSAFIAHGNTSTAYYPVLFIPLVILVAFGINSLKPIFKYLSLTYVICVSVSNTYFLVTNQYLVGPKHASNPLHTFGVPLSEQLQIADFISTQTDNKYQLKAAGKGAPFPSHLDNYRYLLWWTTHTSESDDGIVTWIKPLHELSTPLNSISHNFNTIQVSFQLTL